MTTLEAWLILLLVLALWLTLTRVPLAFHSALHIRWPRGRRPFRPQTPAACPLCHHPSANDAKETAPVSPPPPWRERKSRRGAPKRVHTAGYACANPVCPYVGISDAAVRALVADGHHGRDRIQDFRCQACGRRFSALCRSTTSAALFHSSIARTHQPVQPRAPWSGRGRHS